MFLLYHCDRNRPRSSLFSLSDIKGSMRLSFPFIYRCFILFCCVTDTTNFPTPRPSSYTSWEYKQFPPPFPRPLFFLCTSDSNKGRSHTLAILKHVLITHQDNIRHFPLYFFSLLRSFCSEWREQVAFSRHSHHQSITGHRSSLFSWLTVFLTYKSRTYWGLAYTYLTNLKGLGVFWVR